ncbi:MAG: 16S rRNA (cytosine(1402)-N(4))-methyltransferase RsmH, partial [Calditrichaceae bacterium]|nr:16S rRNA (cytosine(1402)-N(4))-methyltransferase RsmH [Calditrichaceae bacterium]
MSSSYHIPVLASEIAEYLLVNRDGVYIDGTLGGGGHAENFLKILTPKALYIGIDRDSDAIEAAQTRLLPFKNVFFYKGKFSEMENALNQAGQKSADAVLLDLGVSSHQINSPDRGFSFQSDGSLDMRMNRDDSRMAEEIIAHYSEEELKKIFWRFGEERNSGRIARQIVKYRKNKPVTSTGQLKEIINNCVPERFAVKSYARIFQALRIEVNNELG